MSTQEHTSTTLGMFKQCNFPHFVCYQKFDPKIWFFYEGECLDPFTYECVDLDYILFISSNGLNGLLRIAIINKL